MRLLLLMLLACTLSAASATEFSGIIEMAESISGLQADGKDQDEFIRYTAIIENRLKQVRSELVNAPPVVARTLREDLSFCTSELERIAAVTGRELVISTSSYRISRGRVVLATPLIRYRIDRNRGTGQSLTPDGQVADVPLAALPAVDNNGAQEGPLVLGMPTRRFERNLGGKNYIILAAPDLPNVCALTMVSGQTDSELMVALAKLPGLPMQLETRDGAIVRRMAVTRIAPRNLGDDEFAPWK